MDRTAQKAIIYSRLDDMAVRPGKKTGKARRPYVLSRDQITSWPTFFNEIRTISSRSLENPEPQAANPPAPGHYVVAAESGVTSCVVQSGLEQVGKVLEAQGNRVRYADRATGDHVIPGFFPDATAQRHLEDGQTILAVEIKADWNTPLAAESITKRKVLGQLAQYMDQYSCKYGFVCTYREATFVKRTSRFRFAVSPVVLGSDDADATTLSMRECFYALVGRRGEWKYRGQKGGPDLVNGRYRLGRVLRSAQ